MTKYSIERISSANIKHLQTLYLAAFRKRVSLEFIFKKYNTTFTGAELIGYLAFAPDHSPAAFYGVLPCFFRIKGETILAAQSGDTMTHPRHHRQGLFLRLARETYALAKQNHIEFIFGFPNQNSYPGLVKLNWTFQAAPMKLFRLSGSPIPFSKILSKISFISNAYNNFLKRKYQTRNKKEFFLNDLHDGIIKDKPFMDYKAYTKTYFIQIERVPVWIKLDSALKIGYVDVSKITSTENFLKKLIKIALYSGCGHVIFLTTANTPLYKILCPVATPEESFPVGFFKLTDCELDFSNVQFEYCDIDIF